MSAIAGHAALTGAATSAEQVRQMMATMAHRWPDGAWCWSDGRGCLGYGDLVTNAGAAKVHLVEDAGLVIVADVRLDNREELQRSLALCDASMSDPALILAAYRTWNERCAAHLLGDFAFAIWNGATRTLYCARDHLGVKPFYYRSNEDGLQFASEMRALFTRTPSPINERYLADFLVSIAADHQYTLYEDVRRLPPAHFMRWRNGETEIEPYWRISEAPAVIEERDDAALRLRELFTECVRCRLRDAAPVGAFLSGGLDSSSIVAVASPFVAALGEVLRSFSMTFDHSPDRSERVHIDEMVRSTRCKATFVACDNAPPFLDADRMLDEQEGPFIAPGLAMSRRLYYRASAEGVRVILDGHGGDEVISHGLGRLKELAIKRRWRTLWREIAAESGIYGKPAWRVFAGYFLFVGPPRLILRTGFRLFKRARRWLARKPRETPKWRTHLNHDFAERTGVDERYNAVAGRLARFRTEREQHVAAVSSTFHPYAMEILDKVSAAAGVEVRYPFWDKRLLEFCLSLPADQKLRNGWPRWLLREAMAPLLPDTVRWRRDKFDFTFFLAQGMLAQHSPYLQEILSDQAAGLASYIDVDCVRGAHKRLLRAGAAANGLDVQMVWRSVLLALWLAPPRKERSVNSDRAETALHASAQTGPRPT